MSKQKHIHKYIRVNGKFTKIMKCADIHCTFFIHQSQFEILLGRISLCNECGLEFIITIDDLELDLPKCASCKLKKALGLNRSTDVIEINDLDNFLSLKGIE